MVVKKYLLALDSGIGGGRCVLVDLKGKQDRVLNENETFPGRR